MKTIDDLKIELAMGGSWGQDVSGEPIYFMNTNQVVGLEDLRNLLIERCKERIKEIDECCGFHKEYCIKCQKIDWALKDDAALGSIDLETVIKESDLE